MPQDEAPMESKMRMEEYDRLHDEFYQARLTFVERCKAELDGALGRGEINELTRDLMLDTTTQSAGFRQPDRGPSKIGGVEQLQFDTGGNRIETEIEIELELGLDHELFKAACALGKVVRSGQITAEEAEQWIAEVWVKVWEHAPHRVRHMIDWVWRGRAAMEAAEKKLQ
jgi:hypothetical protein